MTKKLGPLTKLLRGPGPQLSAVQPRPYLLTFWPNYAKSPQNGLTQILGALLVASGLLNSYICSFVKIIQKMADMSYKTKTICTSPNLIDFGP